LFLSLLVAALCDPVQAAPPIVTGIDHSVQLKDEADLVLMAQAAGTSVLWLRLLNPLLRTDDNLGSRTIRTSTPFLIPDVAPGVLINKANLTLYLIHSDGSAMVFPVGLGRPESPTPEGATIILDKRTKPTWYPPASVRRSSPDVPKQVPPGDDNPLGDAALRLGWPGILIHGNNDITSISRLSTLGCIRMRNADVMVLMAEVRTGTIVHIVDMPVIIRSARDGVFVQIFPESSQIQGLNENRMPDTAAQSASNAQRLADIAVRLGGMSKDEQGVISTALDRRDGQLLHLRAVRKHSSLTRRSQANGVTDPPQD
jgi:L,D-transpeptidase ErfK/SrfK